MTAIRVFCVFLLVLFLSGQGYAEYDISTIKVEAKTIFEGPIRGGLPRYQVTVKNTSPCVWTQVVLSCDGFFSSGPMKPEVLRKVDGGCLVNNGAMIAREPFVFQFMGRLPAKKFAPVSGQISCS